MAEWQSNAKYGQDLKDGTIFRIKGESDICIHRIHGLGNNFYLTCGRLNIQSFGLNTDSLDVAVENTKKVIEAKMKMLNALYSNFIEDGSENIIVRY